MSESKPVILLVEDEPSMQLLFGFAIKKGGYDVVKASNGKEALEVLSKQVPSAIISDIMMPEMDGFEFREILLGTPGLQSIPFLFLTSYNSEDNILKGIGQQADDFIPKTEGAQVVVSKLKNLLRKRAEIQNRITDELDEASKSTGVLLQPPDTPDVAGFEIAHLQKSYQNIPGGDFVDFLPTPDGCLIVVADVMGKRWKAWVFAHAYAGYIRSSLRVMADESENTSGQVCQPAGLLNRLNAVLYNDEQVETSLCALTLLKLEAGAAGITMGNAFQYPLLCCRAGSGAVEEIQVDYGTMLGLSEKSNFQEKFIPMHQGDVLIAFTDGLSELYGREDQTKGFEMLKIVVQKLFADGKLSPQTVYESMMREAGLSEPDDDVTMIFVRKA
jgi:sigma-B regulation protein RsbU (phosphoserine phosphatase)